MSPSPDPRLPPPDLAGSLVVSVFGSSRITADSSEYREAHELGRLLAEAGYVVCNGGYSGAMEAVSRGAKEAGGRTIGVTVDVFARRSPNAWIDEEIGTETLLLRLDRLTDIAQAYVILYGGIGTLLELALVWNLQVMQVFDRPILLVGPAWRGAVEGLAEHVVIRDLDLAALTFVDTPAEAVEALAASRPAYEREMDWRG